MKRRITIFEVLNKNIKYTKMKKKLICGFAALAICTVATINLHIANSDTVISDISLEDVEGIAACESIGWWYNNGNCVHNGAGAYFCKSDSWHEITDCKQ
jgi:hypothetical protein